MGTKAKQLILGAPWTCTIRCLFFVHNNFNYRKTPHESPRGNKPIHLLTNILFRIYPPPPRRYLRYLLHWSYKLAHDVDWCHWLPKQDNSCERKETQDCFLIWIITAQLLVVLAMRYVCAFWSKEHTHGCYVVYRDPWNLFAQQKKWSAAVLSSFPFPFVSVRFRCLEIAQNFVAASAYRVSWCIKRD